MTISDARSGPMPRDPFFSFSGTSKLFHIAPGELEESFGDDGAIDPFADYPEWRMAAFLLTKK